MPKSIPNLAPTPPSDDPHMRYFALTLAVSKGDMERVGHLLAEGWGKRPDDFPGRGALEIAAARGDLECLALLLNAGAEIDSKGGMGPTALACAAEAGHLDCMRFLLDRGADPHVRWERARVGLLHRCAFWGRLDCLRFLLDLGVGADDPDAHGLTPAMHAASQGQADCLALLLERGADLSARAGGGETLDLFAARGSPACQSVLQAFRDRQALGPIGQAGAPRGAPRV